MTLEVVDFYSFKIAKIIVGVTIVEFCKGGAEVRGRGEGRLILSDCVHKGCFVM